MRNLGGLLKKKRTKDSQSSRDLDPPSSPVAEAPSSPISTHFPHPIDRPARQVSDSSPSYPSAGDPEQLTETATMTASTSVTTDGSASGPMNAIPASIPSTIAPGDTTDVNTQTQNRQNVASINNIINPPQQDETTSQRPDDGKPVVEQPTRTIPRQLKGKYSLEDFSLHRTLGTGSFGRVHLVQSRHNHRFYAIKVLKKVQVVKMKQVEHTNDERRMLQRVKHPFLITLWGTFKDSKNLYMVMDFVEGGELFSLLRKSQVSNVLALMPSRLLYPCPFVFLLFECGAWETQC
jgi:protein kinase A